MGYYEQSVALHDERALFMLPFASTQIRAVVGLAGFLVIVFLSGNGRALFRSLKNGRGMTGAAGGAFTGPFIGVSFSLMAVRYTGTGIASTLMALTPVMILLPGYYFFRQKITLREVLGAIVSVAGVSLFFI
jgi:drug/metabolite transporter (DMT)-like permease